MPTDRPSWLVALSLVVAFGAGPILGMWLAHVLAPGSMVADATGMFAFPLAFAAGLQAWLGFAIFSAVLHLFRRRARQTLPTRGPDVPPGSFVFVPLCITAGLVAGLVVGWMSDTQTMLTSLMAHVSVGALYGAAVWRLARSGYLPFPDTA